LIRTAQREPRYLHGKQTSFTGVVVSYSARALGAIDGTDCAPGDLVGDDTAGGRDRSVMGAREGDGTGAVGCCDTGARDSVAGAAVGRWLALTGDGDGKVGECDELETTVPCDGDAVGLRSRRRGDCDGVVFAAGVNVGRCDGVVFAAGVNVGRCDGASTGAREGCRVGAADGAAVVGGVGPGVAQSPLSNLHASLAHAASHTSLRSMSGAHLCERR